VQLRNSWLAFERLLIGSHIIESPLRKDEKCSPEEFVEPQVPISVRAATFLRNYLENA
jgi:hypothetical protein